jgi:hypothetical protein
MDNIYSHSTGMVNTIAGVGLPALLNFYGVGLNVQPVFAFLSSVQGENEVGHQFMHTLRDFIYVYVFGERMGTLAIGGKAITRGCETYTGTGMAAVGSFYGSNRLTNAIYSPTQPLVQAVLGTGLNAFSIYGFLIKYQAQIPDPDAPFMDFTMTVKTVHN